MKSELKVLFYLKKNQTKKDGLSPIMGRIRIGKTVSQFSLKTEADARLWDIKAGRMTGKSNTALEINREINRINLLIHTRYKELKEVQPEVSAVDVKNAMQGIASTQDTVMVHFQKMVDDASLRLGIDLKESSLAEYKYSYQWLKTFLRKKKNLSDIPFKALTYSFIEEYYHYLRVDKKFKISTTVGYVVFFRKVVRNAVNQGILFRDPFDGFIPEERIREHKTLTRKELDKIMTFEIDPGLKRSISRDIFIFACFTGLAFIDLQTLRWSEIFTDKRKMQWIRKKRSKTGTEAIIPLLDIPLQIIKYYKGSGKEGKVFDIGSYSLVLLYMQELRKLLNMKTLSFHQARHTYATTVCLSNGVPIETLCTMMGHRNISTTQIYSKITKNKVDEDMQVLEKMIDKKYSLPKQMQNISYLNNNDQMQAK